MRAEFWDYGVNTRTGWEMLAFFSSTPLTPHWPASQYPLWLRPAAGGMCTRLHACVSVLPTWTHAGFPMNKYREVKCVLQSPQQQRGKGPGPRRPQYWRLESACTRHPETEHTGVSGLLALFNPRGHKERENKPCVRPRGAAPLTRVARAGHQAALVDNHGGSGDPLALHEVEVFDPVGQLRRRGESAGKVMQQGGGRD